MNSGTSQSQSTCRLLLILILAVFLGSSLPPEQARAQFYNGSQMTFGKNRVQFNNFYWTFYRFKNFDTYFYIGGQDIAAFVGKTGDAEIATIEKLLDFRTDGRLQFIIFNKLSDLKQTNIGLETTELQGNTGGITRIVGNKVLIYFDGNHDHLRQTLRAGVTQVLLEQLMYGGNIKDRLQSSYLLNLPVWFTQGLVSYVSRGWTVDDDNRMRDLVLAGKLRKFNQLVETDELFAGHSLWHFLIESYGEASVSNLVYMTRINRNVESGMNYVFGLSVREVTRNWLAYYEKFYLNADNGRNLPDGESLLKKSRKSRVYSQVRISPDGRKVAYVSNDIGRYRILLYDLQRKRTKVLGRGGYKSLMEKTDDSYPVLLWHPTGRYLTAFSERKGKVWMDYFHVDKRKKERNKFFYYEKVLDASYSDNGQDIILSGVQKGQSDIFVYNIRSHSSQQITKDLYDDLYPRFVNNSRFVVFSSNRISDTLDVDQQDLSPPASNLDLFMYDYADKSRILKRITSTPGVNEMQPVPIDSLHFGFLSAQNGIFNFYASRLDSVISFIDTTEHYRYVFNSSYQTNYARNIEQHDVNFFKTKHAQLIYYNGRYRIFVNPLLPPVMSSLEPAPTPFMKQRAAVLPAGGNTNKQPDVVRFNEEPQLPDSSKIDINNYVFQSEFPRKNRTTGNTKLDRMKNKNASKSLLSQQTDSLPYRLPKQRNYDLAFYTDYFQMQFGKSLTNTTYQAYSPGTGFFQSDFVNELIRLGVSDLMNDYKLTGGVSISLFDFKSREYMVSYENLKKRMDKQVTFYRHIREVSDGFDYTKVISHELKYISKYPFHDLAALRGSIAMRQDNTIYRSTDKVNLERPNRYQYWGSAYLEYVFDNTITRALNILNGTRYKIFAEGYKQFDVPDGWLGVAGFDFRHYEKIHRQIIWASRLSGSTSFGDMKLIYYLGSEDNAIIPVKNFDYSIHVDETKNYAFQALAAPMRGYRQNIRNGNSFVLLNNEIRVPVFAYLLNKPIRSDFIRNFQVITFLDIGTAWTGDSPYSKDNGFNQQVINQYPFTISLTKQVEPVVAGYGFGLRSRLFGYFIRADWAWGYEDYEVRKNMFYLALGLDF